MRAALSAMDATVEHVGSTAVPGLVAKPVIDVDVVVHSHEDVADARQALEAVGYVAQGDLGIAGREAFLAPSGTSPHHLYVVVAGTPPHVAHIRFRDHLRAHPPAAAEYGALKVRLAKAHCHDRVGYVAAKSAFVEQTLQAALADGGDVSRPPR